MSAARNIEPTTGRLWGGVAAKLRLAVGLVLLMVIGLLGGFYLMRQEAASLAQYQRILLGVGAGVAAGLKTVMLSGRADVTADFTARLRHATDLADITVIRGDGSEAFRDASTITEVNRRLGRIAFPDRPDQAAPQVLPAGDPALATIAGGGMVTRFHTGPDGDDQVTLLVPITTEPGCQGCHGPGTEPRGAVKLTASLAPVAQQTAATWRATLPAMLAAFAAAMAVTEWLVRRRIARRLDRIAAAMARVGEGDLTQALPVVPADEIGSMGESFNSMTRQLARIDAGLRHERDKLTTVLLGSHDGIVVTDAGDRVVLVNPAAERLLGKSAAQLTAGGFEALFDDTAWMSRQRGAGVPALRHQGERLLEVHVATIHGEHGAPIGSAALLRDVTAARRLQAELERLSVTDALTHLYNRRGFDARLAEELKLARRYGDAVSLLLIDVDHFKRFNDDHGHDMGDRVLQAVADLMRQRHATDLPCRYGGEEFAVILPGAAAAAALAAAEALRAAIAGLEICGLSVTASIGVATSPPAEPSAIVKAADLALYQAKDRGRNRVEAAPG